MKGEAIARDGVAAALSSCRISDILPARATTLYREVLCKIFPSFYSDQCTGSEARKSAGLPLRQPRCQITNLSFCAYVL